MTRPCSSRPKPGGTSCWGHGRRIFWVRPVKDAEEYASSVVKADLEEPGEEDVFRKVRADFDAGGVDQSDHQIRRRMAELLDVAVEQINQES